MPNVLNKPTSGSGKTTGTTTDSIDANTNMYIQAPSDDPAKGLEVGGGTTAAPVITKEENAQIQANLGINNGITGNKSAGKSSSATSTPTFTGSYNAGGASPISTANSYGDITGNKQAYTATGNTGSGIEAAVGTEYSWNKQGAQRATTTYSSDVLTAKQNALNNAQTINNNAVNYQAQADMMKYQNNQSAEKVGWTGGYVLDQNRQMDYLKASIQAQMYSAVELQKYGYDTSLAAARLSYDLNQQEFARQYYQDAVSAALSEAQQTGTYFSAETKDMMGQLAVAQEKLKDKTLSQADREQAQKVIDTIEGWFSSNNVSKTGVQTLEAWYQDQANELQWSNELWTRYNAAEKAVGEELSTNVDMFIQLDENGNPAWDGVNLDTGNWSNWAGSDIAEYISGDKSGKRTQQLYSYFSSQLAGETEANFNTWLKSKGYIETDENGNQTVAADDYKDLFGEFLAENDSFSKFLTEKFGSTSDSEKEIISNALNGFSFEVRMPDGTYATYTLSLTDKPEGKDEPEGQDKQGGNDGKTSTTVIKDGTPISTILKGIYGEQDESTEIGRTYASINSMLNALNESTNIEDWVDNDWKNTFANAGWQGMIVRAVDGFAYANSNQEKAKALNEIEAGLIATLGQKNFEAIYNKAKEFNTLTDRDVKLLTDKQKQEYSQAIQFMDTIDKLNAAKDYYQRNDSVPFTWDYVGDRWKQVGYNWSNVSSFGDILGSLGDSINAVLTTIHSGFYGFWQKLFTWSW